MYVQSNVQRVMTATMIIRVPTMTPAITTPLLTLAGECEGLPGFVVGIASLVCTSTVVAAVSVGTCGVVPVCVVGFPSDVVALPPVLVHSPGAVD